MSDHRRCVQASRTERRRSARLGRDGLNRHDETVACVQDVRNDGGPNVAHRRKKLGVRRAGGSDSSRRVGCTCSHRSPPHVHPANQTGQILSALVRVRIRDKVPQRRVDVDVVASLPHVANNVCRCVKARAVRQQSVDSCRVPSDDAMVRCVANGGTGEAKGGAVARRVANDGAYISQWFKVRGSLGKAMLIFHACLSRVCSEARVGQGHRDGTCDMVKGNAARAARLLQDRGAGAGGCTAGRRSQMSRSDGSVAQCCRDGRECCVVDCVPVEVQGGQRLVDVERAGECGRAVGRLAGGYEEQLDQACVHLKHDSEQTASLNAQIVSHEVKRLEGSVDGQRSGQGVNVCLGQLGTRQVKATQRRRRLERCRKDAR
mmetsp:Transcript_1381/g.4335  ORF Transcript_1381/g.4335 Transcript_1381/m.4335 type:complete len:375 (-) Transcript_1381:1029-2153(-)